MPTSRNAAVAEAVKAALNAADQATRFGQTFTARRVYDVMIDLDRVGSALDVCVLAAGDEATRLSRGGDQHEITVQVGLRKRLSRAADATKEASNAEIDALAALAETVADFFGPAGNSGADYGGGQWLRTKHAPVADAETLRDKRTFLSVITLTFFYSA